MTVISKKIAKKAHDRNKIRRRILYAVRVHKLQDTLPLGAYQIRVAKKQILEYTYQELEKEVLDGLEKLGKSVKAAK